MESTVEHAAKAPWNNNKKKGRTVIASRHVIFSLLWFLRWSSSLSIVGTPSIWRLMTYYILRSSSTSLNCTFLMSQEHLTTCQLFRDLIAIIYNQCGTSQSRLETRISTQRHQHHQISLTQWLHIATLVDRPVKEDGVSFACDADSLGVSPKSVCRWFDKK